MSSAAPAATDDADRRLRDAMTLHQHGDVAGAAVQLATCIAEHPRYLRAYTTLATLHAQQGHFAEAEAVVRAGLTVAPTAAPAHHLLAKTLHRQGRLADAAASYRAALEHGPATPELLIEFGSLLLDTGQIDEGEGLLHQALAAQPNQTKALTLLGRAAELRGDLTKAIAFHDRAMALQPGNAHAYLNRGAAKRWSDDLAGALRDFDQALTLHPGLPGAIANRGLVLLAMGRLAEGWSDYRVRVRARDGEPDFSADRPWDGAPLDGKRILTWTEYGLGDEIMAASLLPELAQRAAHCTVVCSPRIAPLFRRSFANVDFVTDGKVCGDFDARLPLLDAAMWLRPAFDSFPHRQQFLAADATETAALRHRYGERNRLIGISWSSTSIGTGPFKSTHLADWTKILDLPGARFVSLQYAADGAEITSTGTDIIVDPAVDPVGDVDTFAAQIAAMDLVITVSNSTAHIAGALGKPTWLLVPEGPGAHWYWFKDRADSPWYPSIRIFRQPQPGDWSSVIADVSRALHDWARP